MNITDFIEKNVAFNIEKHESGKLGAIYFICEEDGKIIYIGCTMTPYFRFKTHYERVDFCNKPIYFFWHPILKCRKLEQKLIKQIKPKYNVHWNNKRLKPKHWQDVILPQMKPKKKHTGSEVYEKLEVPKIKDKTQIRNQILNYMIKKKATQSDLSKLLGVSRQRISQITTGDGGFSKKLIKRIEKALNIKIN